MDLECFTLLDPDALFLYLSARFRKVRPKIRAPRLFNLFESSCLPLLTDQLTGSPVALESGSSDNEIRIRSVIESSLLLYLKHSLYAEEGLLWKNIVSDDIYRNVGLLYRMYAEHVLVKKSVLVQSGEITDENSAEAFREQLTNQALDDLTVIESILKDLSGDECHYINGQHPGHSDALVASVVVPLSLEGESTKIGAKIRQSPVLSQYVRRFKIEHLDEHGVFVSGQEDLTPARKNWRKLAQGAMIATALYMILAPRLRRVTS